MCSVIDHIIKFDYKQTAENLISLRKDVYNAFIKIVIFTCFANAVNFNANIAMPIINVGNKLYLGFVVFYSMLMLCSFVLRSICRDVFLLRPIRLKTYILNGSYCGGDFF